MYGEIQELGGSVFLIGPETEESALRLCDKAHATIPVLFDSDGAVIRAYRLAFTLPPALQEAYAKWGLDLPAGNPATGWDLPIPATFVLDRQRIVRARYINADYTRRMEPADVLAAVRAVVGR